MRVNALNAYGYLLACKEMLSGDIRNDLVKVNAHFEPTSPETDEADLVDKYRLDEDPVLIAKEQQKGERNESFLIVRIGIHFQLGASDHSVEKMKSWFFEKIVIETRDNLGLKEVPIFL